MEKVSYERAKRNCVSDKTLNISVTPVPQNKTYLPLTKGSRPETTYHYGSSPNATLTRQVAVIEPIARKDIQQVRKNKPVASDSSGSSGQKGQPRDQDILSKGKPPVTSSSRKTVAETATLVTARPAAVIDTTSTSEGDTDQV